MHDEEYSFDDLKQENKILRNELTKLCQEITIQSETEERISKFHFDIRESNAYSMNPMLDRATT